MPTKIIMLNKIVNRNKKELILQPTHVKAFRFIERFITKNHFAPNMKEVSSHMSSDITPRHTYRIVDELCEMGYLSRVKFRNRSLKVEKIIGA